MDMRTYRYPVPGDHAWRATVECASGVTDENVTFYAPPGFTHTALFTVAPGTRLLALKDCGAVSTGR
jgi:hypothetical protein